MRNFSRPYRIKIIVDRTPAVVAQMLDGVTEYSRLHQPLVFELQWINENRVSVVGEGVDGVVIYGSIRESALSVHRWGGPVVDVVSDHYPDLGFPVVAVDDVAVGRLAAEDLLSRGFDRLAFLGVSDRAYARQRLEGFKQVIEARGLACEVVDQDDAESGAWLDRLAMQTHFSVAALVANDRLGGHLVTAATQRGIRIPQQLALIGVDNDPHICLLCYPHLSSIVTPCERIGFLATQRVIDLIEGKPMGSRVQVLPPVELITRHSSDILAVDEPHIAKALARIRAEACDGMTVVDLVRDLPMSRRGFEMAFQRCIGITPGREIRRVRIERAKLLLADTALPLPDVAARCGFKTASHFGEAFLRETGHSPGRYRRVGQ